MFIVHHKPLCTIYHFNAQSYLNFPSAFSGRKVSCSQCLISLTFLWLLKCKNSFLPASNYDNKKGFYLYALASWKLQVSTIPCCEHAFFAETFFLERVNAGQVFIGKPLCFAKLTLMLFKELR